jgi:hypothetical protein
MCLQKVTHNYDPPVEYKRRAYKVMRVQYTDKSLALRGLYYDTVKDHTFALLEPGKWYESTTEGRPEGETATVYSQEGQTYKIGFHCYAHKAAAFNLLRHEIYDGSVYMALVEVEIKDLLARGKEGYNKLVLVSRYIKCVKVSVHPVGESGPYRWKKNLKVIYDESNQRV